MGWDTEIIILAENIRTKKVVQKIQGQIFHKDSKYCTEEICFFFKNNGEFCLYYHYEKRKYAPYRAIREISKDFPKVQFTILGSELDFISGPGGIIRINDGAIIDSYGIWPYESARNAILKEPIRYKKAIYKWYSIDGLESQQRRLYEKQYPLDWCEGDYSKKLIPIDENEIKEMIENEKYDFGANEWEEQSKIKLFPDYEKYKEDLKKVPQSSLVIDESSFMAFIEYNEKVRDIENEFESIIPCEIIKSGIGLYRSNFGVSSPNRNFLIENFKTVQDIENHMVSHKERIIEYGREKYEQKKGIILGKGYSFRWMIALLRKESN